MQISCESIHTDAIAEVRFRDGGLAWRLDPDHFTTRLAQALALLLSKIACHWTRDGGQRVDLIVSRTSMPDSAPALVVERPGALSIALSEDHLTAAGAEAFERAMNGELAHWCQLVA